MKQLTTDELDALKLSLDALKGANVSVAGGVLAFEKYLSAVQVVEMFIVEVMNDYPEFEPKKPERTFRVGAPGI